ncbi:MAG: amidohydrolase family protein [Deltaproteobacteria bacterium]|nr:amidohydrolase family protein [Deltaproteobacteria bacterium]
MKNQPGMKEEGINMQAIRQFGLAITLAALVAPHPAEAETMAIKAAGYVDVRAGKLVTPALIVVEGERIVGVNTAKAPDGAKIIELGDLILMPGMIDVHTHLAFDDTTPGWAMLPVLWTPADFALFGVQAARRVLAAGFTTVRDVSAWPGLPDVALARAIERGWVKGPRMFPSAHALGTTGGHCDLTGMRPGVLEATYREGIADGPDEVTKAVRYQIKHGAKVIKICATAGVASFESSADAQQFSDAELIAAVEEATRHGMKVAAHAHGTAGIIAATRAGVASIEHGSILTKEAANLMVKNGTYLVPTLYLSDMEEHPVSAEVAASDAYLQLAEKDAYLSQFVESSFRLAIKKGIKLALGSDLDAVGAGDNAKELYSMVRRGLPIAEALRVATINGADLIGVDDRGEIAEGLLADLIAVSANPLEDVRIMEDVQWVMQGGIVVKGD